MARRAAGAVAFDVLFEHEQGEVPEELTAAERAYGGPLRFPPAGRLHVFANFVTSVDGVASLGIGGGTDSSTLSGRDPADRFLMAMLRAAADVVLIGAHTLRDTPGHQWVAQVMAPEHAEVIAEFERSAGRRTGGTLAILSASGELPDHVALRAPATPVVVVTSAAGAARARAGAPDARILIAGERSPLDASAVVDLLESELQARRVLCEGGPGLLGTLLAGGRLDELFLTVSPKLAGSSAPPRRRGLVEGWVADPDSLVDLGLCSVRRSGDHLFLRYRLTG